MSPGIRRHDADPFPRFGDICRKFDQIEDGVKPLIIDCGANIGLSSLYLAKNWPSAHIIAIEPDDRNFASLCANVRAHSNIQPIRAAVGGEDGPVAILDKRKEEWAYQTTRLSTNSPDAIPGLSIRTVKGMATPSQRYQPFLIKIDIEGAEKDLFSAKTDWISEFPVIIIELHDWMLPGQGTSRPFLEAIAPLDRDFVYFGENVFSFANEPSMPNRVDRQVSQIH